MKYVSKKSIISAIASVRQTLKRRKKNSRKVKTEDVLTVLRERLMLPFDEAETSERIEKYVAQIV